MSRFILRIIINAVALWVAAQILGVERMNIPNDLGGVLLVALVFGFVNALIRPLVSFFTCLLNLLTLGLFTFVINAAMLMLTGWITGRLQFDNFWWAVVGGVVVTIVSTLLSWFLPDEDSSRSSQERRRGR